MQRGFAPLHAPMSITRGPKARLSFPRRRESRAVIGGPRSVEAAEPQLFAFCLIC